jgi:hypothetical protein
MLINSTKPSEHNIKVQSTNFCTLHISTLRRLSRGLYSPSTSVAVKWIKPVIWQYIDELLLHKLKRIIRWYESLPFIHQQIAWKQCVFGDATTVLANMHIPSKFLCFSLCWCGMWNFYREYVFRCKKSCDTELSIKCRPQWPRGLSCRSSAARLLRSWFRIPPGHGYLSVVSVVCCQVEVSATGWSFVQRSPTDCGGSLCVI